MQSVISKRVLLQCVMRHADWIFSSTLWWEIYVLFAYRQLVDKPRSSNFICKGFIAPFFILITLVANSAIVIVLSKKNMQTPTNAVLMGELEMQLDLICWIDINIMRTDVSNFKSITLNFRMIDLLFAARYVVSIPNGKLI